VISAGGGGECLSWCSAVRVRGNGPCAAGAVGRPDLCRRAIGNPPGAQEPGGFGGVDALEAALRACLGLPPVS
jgi:hypothetical protein